jgi:hypothetical protein
MWPLSYKPCRHRAQVVRGHTHRWGWPRCDPSHRRLRAFDGAIAQAPAVVHMKSQDLRTSCFSRHASTSTVSACWNFLSHPSPAIAASTPRYPSYPGCCATCACTRSLPHALSSSSASFWVYIYIYRTRAVAGIGSACGPGASPTPDLRGSARAIYIEPERQLA